MSFVLKKNATRVFLSKAGVLTDITDAMRAGWTNPGLLFTGLSANTDFIYFGQRHAFNNKYVSLVGAGNTNPAKMKFEYWASDQWRTFHRPADGTNGFANSGWINWEERLEWTKRDTKLIPEFASLTQIDDEYWDQFFWMRISLDAAPTDFTVRNIKLMLADGSYFPQIYPELDQYLPTGQSDWMPQLELAKDFLIKELIQKNIISYEDQIKNIDDWTLHCSYRTIVLILAPITGDERLIKVREEMRKMADSTFIGAAASIDVDKNEILDPKEMEPGKMDWLSR